MTSASSMLLLVLAVAVAVSMLFLIPRAPGAAPRPSAPSTACSRSPRNRSAPTLRELRSTLENLDRITTDISSVTDDVRMFSGSVRQVGKDVQRAAATSSALLGGGVGAKIAGLRAGVGAGVAFLAKNLLRKGGTP